MKCENCGKPAGKNKQGIPKTYCSKKCRDNANLPWSKLNKKKDKQQWIDYDKNQEQKVLDSFER